MKGPGSGRDTAVRSIQNTGHRGHVDQGRHAGAAQRLPSAEASEGLSHGSLHRSEGARHAPPRRQHLREREGPQGARAPSVPARCPRPHAPPQRRQRVPRPAAGEAEGEVHLRPARAAVPQDVRRGHAHSGHDRSRTCCACSRLRLDNIVYRAGWASTRPQARQFVNHGLDQRQRQARRHPELPRPQGRRRVAVAEGRGHDRRPAQHRRARPQRRRLARSRRRRQAGHRPRPAPARAHRRARPRVSSSSSCTRSKSSRSSASERTRPPMLVMQRPTVEAIGEETNNRQRFAVGPLEPGFGHTLGNSLRRTLLSSIPGAAITTVRFDDALHEFDTINGVAEDVTDIILNFKDIVLTSEADEAVNAAPRRARSGRGHRRRHRVPGRRRDPQQGPPHRHAQRQGPSRDRPHRRAGPRLLLEPARGRDRARSV